MALVVAFVVTLVLTPLAGVVARRAGIVDLPGPLKPQRVPVPYLGGVAVLGGALVGPIAAGRPAVCVPLVGALALGTADDMRPLPPGLRLLAELGLAAVAAVSVPGDVPARAATAVLVVVLLNAVNLLDGLDGLAAGVALVSALAFAFLGGDARVVGLALAGALGGFLVFNRPPARIYLGDGGSYLVGTALAVCPILTADGTTSWSVWLAVPLIVAVPVADTLIAIARRVRAGSSVFAGDRSHVYDQLVDRGRSVASSTAFCVAGQAVIAAVGVLAAGLHAGWTFLVTAIGVVAIGVSAVAGGFVGPPRGKP